MIFVLMGERGMMKIILMWWCDEGVVIVEYVIMIMVVVGFVGLLVVILCLGVV